MSTDKKSKWLYVLPEDISEAFAFGATYIDGDARMIMPSPLPDGLTEEAFERWKSPEAIKAWVFRYTNLILKEELGVEDKKMTSEGSDKVYLFVPQSDAPSVSQIDGVLWDSSVGSFYVKDPAYLAKVFYWLTPVAKAREERECLARRLEERILGQKAVLFKKNTAPTDRTLVSIKKTR